MRRTYRVGRFLLAAAALALFIAGPALAAAPPKAVKIGVTAPLTGPAAEAGVTIEDAQNVLVAVAPIIGTARTMTAGINIAEALELAIAVIAEGSE